MTDNPPLLRVVRGNPTPEELAALIAVVTAAAAAGTGAESDDPHSPWGAPAGLHRRPLPAPGPGAWRSAI